MAAVEFLPMALAGVVWLKLTLVSVTLDRGPYPEDRYVGAATLGAILLMWAPLPLLSRGARFAAAWLLDLMLTALTVVDVVHLRFFGEFPSIPDLGRASQIRVGYAAAVAACKPQDLILAADLVLALACVPWYRRAGRARPAGTGRHGAARRSGIILAAAAVLGAPVVRAIAIDREELYRYTWCRREVVRGIGLLPYHLHDAYVQLAFGVRGRLTTSAADRRRVAVYFEAEQRRDRRPSRLFGVARDRNLIVVMVESLQAFPLGIEIGGRPVTPNLRRFAAESLHFVEFFDQTHLGTTSDGEFVSLQSLHPLDAGAVATRYPLNHFRGLPAVLADQGYTTISAVGEPGDEWNMLQMHPNLGFRRSFFKSSFRTTFEIGPGIADDVFFPQAAALLRSQPRPFMAYLLTLSTHPPFDIPSHLRELDLGSLANTPLGRYLEAVHYFDRAFGGFVDALRVAGLLEATVVAVYGDHHAHLDDPPELAHLLGIAPEDRRARWKVERRLPFLIRLPGTAGAGTRGGAAGHLDVAPTLLGLLGIDPDALVALGHDLTSGQGKRVVFRDGSFIDAEHEYMRRPGTGEASTGYDARTGARLDPAGLEAKSRLAAEELMVSDIIVRADMVPELTRAREARR